MSDDKTQTWNILIFETMGTALFVYGSVASLGNNYAISMCLFGCIVLFGRLTGGHFNPASTLSLSIMNEISAGDFFIYLIGQFLGAFLGGVLAFSMLSMDEAPYMQEKPIQELAGSIFAEVFGSVIFTVFILVQNIKETKITLNPLLNYILLVGTYYAAREFTVTSSNSLLNPAAATSLGIFNCLYLKRWDQIMNLWIFIVGPFGASFLGSLFYSQIYRKQAQQI